jgi:hypothetical protein
VYCGFNQVLSRVRDVDEDSMFQDKKGVTEDEKKQNY